MDKIVSLVKEGENNKLYLALRISPNYFFSKLKRVFNWCPKPFSFLFLLLIATKNT